MAKSECSTYMRPVLKAISVEENTIYLFQPRCKQWSCPYCAALNQQYWCAKIAEGIRYYWDQGENEWTFVTLTSHPKLKTKQQTLHVWPMAWSKLSRSIRYHFRSPHYTLLPELHKDGRLHSHMIISSIITRSWLKTYAPRAGLGYMVDVQTITEPRYSVLYTTKYLGKAAKDQEWPKNLRRIRTSQHWPELEQPQAEDWLELQWEWLTTYPAEGIEYLAAGLRESRKVDVKVIR